MSVNKPEATLFVLLFPFYFAVLGLYHFMVFAVNKRLPARMRIPHSLFWSGWNRVRDEYRNFYPKSSAYGLTLACAVVVALLALAIVGVRVWEYATGRLQ